MTTVPKGFRFAVAAAGFKRADRNDLGLIVSNGAAVAAGVFTKDRFQAAPVLVCKELLTERPFASALLVNSGQANACTGLRGLANRLIATPKLTQRPTRAHRRHGQGF